MTCTVCGKRCVVMEHVFRSDAPPRTWVAHMPLYFRGDVPFCSPDCSTDWLMRGANRERAEQ
jgi:hypothetical protein